MWKLDLFCVGWGKKYVRKQKKIQRNQCGFYLCLSGFYPFFRGCDRGVIETFRDFGANPRLRNWQGLLGALSREDFQKHCWNQIHIKQTVIRALLWVRNSQSNSWEYSFFPCHRPGGWFLRQTALFRKINTTQLLLSDSRTCPIAFFWSTKQMCINT